jgi:hypothetical protein
MPIDTQRHALRIERFCIGAESELPWLENKLRPAPRTPSVGGNAWILCTLLLDSLIGINPFKDIFQDCFIILIP